MSAALGRAMVWVMAAGALLSMSLSAHAQELDLEKALAEAVDLPSPEARRGAALKLAAREDVSLDGLLQTMQGFGSFPEHLAGVVRERVSVWTGAGLEEKDVYVYVPEGYDPKRPAPLLMAAHGSGGDGRREYIHWEQVADALGMLVVAHTEERAEGGYTFLPEERLAAQGVIRWTRRNFNVDENRIYLTGISRGGHLAWDLALRLPDRYAGIAPMIGGPRWNIANGQNNLRYLENVAWMPIRDLQGWRDHPGLLFNLELAFEKLEAMKAVDAQLLRFPELGHSFELDSVDWKRFWGASRREPIPTTVVRLSARKDETRAFWLEITALGSKVAETFVPKISPTVWAKLDDDGKRRYQADEADKKTARLFGRYLEPGRFALEPREVKRARILLAEGMFLPGQPVEVKWKGKARKKPVTPNKGVLLSEFVERFDRTFLPVAEVSVP